MNLSDDTVRYVAGLANLRLTEDEVKRLSHDLGQILTHIEQLNEITVVDVAPMAQVLYGGDEIAALREDRPHETLTNAAALGNAPASGGGYFKVPKVIER